MTIKEEVAEYIHSIVDTVRYDSNAFTIWYSGDKVIIGALIDDAPEADRFFNYATIYNTIKDVDQKVKLSLEQAIKWAEDTNMDTWQPFQGPSDAENLAIYYTENAIFRTAVLWDLLAQLFNLKIGIGRPFDGVYTKQIFHDAQQGKRGNLFAKKVYAYMEQSDNPDTEPCEGNYEYVREFRDKMTHRVSPNITSISNYATELRMPMLYVLKRVVEDYKQVAEFIQEVVTDILKDYQTLNSINPSDEEATHA